MLDRFCKSFPTEIYNLKECNCKMMLRNEDKTTSFGLGLFVYIGETISTVVIILLRTRFSNSIKD